MKGAGFLLLVGLTAISAPAGGLEIPLKGILIQGGLLVGSVPKGARVSLDGNAQPVSSEGAFLIGLGRDAPTECVLEVHHKGERILKRTLKIQRRDYQVQRINGLPRRKITPSPEDLRRIKYEGTALAAAQALISDSSAFRSGFAWPAQGRISGVYGSLRILNGQPRRPHLGVDVAAPAGTPVLAAAAGRVTFAHPRMFFNGKTVIIDHGLGLSSAYLHLSVITVKPGTRVKKGNLIGRVGKTGRVTGAHLHWGLRLRGIPLDPQLLVPPMEHKPAK